MTSQETETQLDERSQAIWQRLGGLFGLAAVGLIVAGKWIGDPNGTAADINPDQSGVVIANRLIEHRDAIERGTSLLVLGVFFFLAFVAWVANRYRSSRASEQWITWAAIGGGITAAALMLVEAAIWIAVVEFESFAGDEGIARMFAALTWNWLTVLALPLAAFVASVSLGLVRAGRAEAVIGWAGLGAAALSLIPPVAWVGFLAALVWMLALSIVLLLAPSRRDRVAPTGAVLPRGA